LHQVQWQQRQQQQQAAISSTLIAPSRFEPTSCPR
jgi:hypothetical protein